MMKAQDLEQVLELVAKAKLDDNQRGFIDQWLVNFPTDELVGRKPENIAGWLVDLALQSSITDSHLRVYNPSIEREGWQANNSIITLNWPDLPFLVDTLRIALDTHGIEVRMMHSHVSQSDSPRCFMYFEVGRRERVEEIDVITESLRVAISTVESVVDAFPAIIAKVESVSDAHKGNDERTYEFLEWLRREHFIFLGYSRWQDCSVTDCLGVMTTLSEESDDDLTNRNILAEGESIAFTKSSSRSLVHRHVYSDYVVVRDANDPSIEHRFLGLFTASTYHESPQNIPVIREKVDYVLDRVKVPTSSHDGKVLRQLLSNYPTDEFFHATPEELYTGVNRALRLQERPIVRVVIRRGRMGRFVSCIVYVPRERYTTELRKNIQRFLCDELDAVDSEFNTFFSGSNHARVRFILRTTSADSRDIDLAWLENTILDMCREWPDRLRDTLCETLGDEQGSRLASLYQGAFPAAYREDYDTRFAAQDIVTIDKMAMDQSLGVHFYRSVVDESEHARFRVFRFDAPLELSDVLPKFENLGLRVIGERPYEVERRDHEMIWLHDFYIRVSGVSNEDIDRRSGKVQEAFEAVWNGSTEDDRFNTLVLTAGLEWQKVAILRSYARYMFQIQFGFSLDYIAETLTVHSEIAAKLVALFESYFDPEAVDNDRTKSIKTELNEAIEQVESLDEDRILRRFVSLIDGTVRTNFYKPTRSGEPRSVLSFKLNTRSIPDIPKPKPFFEIFVCSPRTEGVHLRGGPVARGGLRWSDRFEDFRTEVLGLVKAQQVKNSVIVPQGAKGGFVARQTDPSWSRERFMDEGIACYKEFISALLDVTDNRNGTDIIPPSGVVCRDAPDPYLVVAADKGTATFSDIANSISAEYDFWLGDAFASGGSQGYDHKKMGITAKGAWVSVQRHFRELGTDVQKDPVSVVGIGDMSGDVFGNGMLLSETLELVAAFNHRHIFIDPNPDAKASFLERKRLFDRPRSGWDDYDEALISSGGGIFSRGAKFIDISSEMKSRFKITEDRLSPNQLIHEILKAPLDLLWNGGIGTYVKGSSETHADVGDKANDGLRVNGRELGVKVVGEGGNLGLTQLGRVEYSIRGGRCNTDFIDNAGGVDCSDHEVNIKILLNELVRAGSLAQSQRDTLLEEMTDDVSRLVLKNNASQAQAISLEEIRSEYRVGDHRRFIADLEDDGIIDRELEFLPDDDAIASRMNETGKALSRPELSVLVSYAKMELKRSFCKPNLVTGQYRFDLLSSAFPSALVSRYKDEVESHQLADEIVATQLANEIVNYMGITFIHRLRKSTGASEAQIAHAWIFCREVFGVRDLWRELGDTQLAIPERTQLELLEKFRRMIRRGARWYVKNLAEQGDLDSDIQTFAEDVQTLRVDVGSILSDRQLSRFQARKSELEQNNVPEQLATVCASVDYGFALLSVVDVARTHSTPVACVARIYFEAARRLKVNDVHYRLTSYDVNDQWEALAREVNLDELNSIGREITSNIISLTESNACSNDEALEEWLKVNANAVKQWMKLMEEMESTRRYSFALFAVAIRALAQLSSTT